MAKTSGKSTPTRKLWAVVPTIVPETQEIEVDGKIVRFYISHGDVSGRGKVSIERKSLFCEAMVYTCYISSRKAGEAIVATDPGRLKYHEYFNNEMKVTICHVLVIA